MTWMNPSSFVSPSAKLICGWHLEVRPWKVIRIQWDHGAGAPLCHWWLYKNRKRGSSQHTCSLMLLQQDGPHQMPSWHQHRALHFLASRATSQTSFCSLSTLQVSWQKTDSYRSLTWQLLLKRSKNPGETGRKRKRKRIKQNTSNFSKKTLRMYSSSCMPRGYLGWEGITWTDVPQEELASKEIWVCSRGRSPRVLWGLCGQGDLPGPWSVTVLMYSECVTLQGPHNGLDSLVYRIQSVIDSWDTPEAQASVCASRNRYNCARSWQCISGTLCREFESWPLKAKLGRENTGEVKIWLPAFLCTHLSIKIING